MIEAKLQTLIQQSRDKQADQTILAGTKPSGSSKLKGFEALKALPDLDQE